MKVLVQKAKQKTLKKRKFSHFSGKPLADNKVRPFALFFCNLTLNCYEILLIFKISTFFGILIVV
jgi:hypothetical protein